MPTGLTRRIATYYGAVSLFVLIVGAMLEELPLPLGSILYSVVWIVLGPLIALFYTSGDPRMIIPYLIGSALLLPSLLLVARGSRTAQIAGYCTAIVVWPAVGFLLLLAAWGA